MLEKVGYTPYTRNNFAAPKNLSFKGGGDSNEQVSDNKRNRAMTYMIGATAVAGLVALAILARKSGQVKEILAPDEKAKNALSDLYQKVIEKAQKSGNDKRAKIFEQAKNNISTDDKKLLYGNLLDALYKDLRLGEYSSSGIVTRGIENITSQSTSLIRVKESSGWHFRIPKTRQSSKTVDRVSVNALADENLIKALDDLFASGQVKGYYKTPDQALNWLERHDPITIYLDEKADKSILDKIRKTCEKYIRSTDDVLSGDKFAPGMALQKSPNKQDIEALLSQAKNIDPQLEETLRKQFTDLRTGDLIASAGYIDATKKLLGLLG